MIDWEKVVSVVPSESLDAGLFCDQLSPDEIEFIKAYRAMDDSEKEGLVQYIENMFYNYLSSL